MTKTFIMLALALMIASTAQAQTRVGITGSVITYNGGSTSSFSSGFPTSTPWAAGVVIGKIGDDSLRISFEHFEQVIDSFTDNSHRFKQQTSWAIYNAI